MTTDNKTPYDELSSKEQKRRDKYSKGLFFMIHPVEDGYACQVGKWPFRACIPTPNPTIYPTIQDAMDAMNRKYKIPSTHLINCPITEAEPPWTPLVKTVEELESLLIKNGRGNIATL